jgi:transcriptional regulator with XRE-family HTH domain
MSSNVDLVEKSPYADIVQVRKARDLGAVIKGQRRSRNWTQAQLADAVGTTRAWVIAIEHGKASAELGLVLRTLAALDLVADIVPVPSTPGTIDLDEVLGDRDG